MESDASGKDQADVLSEGSDSKPVNVEVGCGESEDEDEELYIFPQCAPAPAPAAAPKRRAAQPSSLTPVSILEGRAASPAPLTTADVSGGRTTPATVVSVNEGSGPAKFEGSGVSTSPSVGREGSDGILNEDVQESPVPSTRGTETGEAMKLYLRLCWVGGKLRDSSGQQKVQLEPCKVERVEMFAVCKHFMKRLLLLGKLGWRLRLMILFFLRLMVHA